MSKPDATHPLLDELDSLRGLLAPGAGPAAEEADIPVLDEVIDAAAAPLARREIEAIVDQVLERELNRLRRALRNRLLAEVSARLGLDTSQG